MGKNVLALMKVLPDDIDTDLDKLAEAISGQLPEGCVIEKKDEEPIAFGLKALKLRVIIPAETEGGTTPVEEAIAKVKGVQRVETEMVSLM